MLNERSIKNLKGVNQKLVDIVYLADKILEQKNTGLGFIITCGLRTVEEQKRMVEIGASDTMDSKHLTGHAVDLAATVDGLVKWDWPLYAKLNEVMQEAAKKQGVKLGWGGYWKKPADGPHFQIDRG